MSFTCTRNAVRRFILPVLGGLLLALSACNKRVSEPPGVLPPQDRINIAPFGTANTLEIATWNIEFFPKLGTTTINNVKEIIRDLDVDIFALQEIADSDAFEQLLDSLPDYEGRIGFGASSFNQWPAIIYRHSMITILNESYPFAGEFNFPRAPYTLQIRATRNAVDFDFTLMILHLKAFGDQTSEDRRRGAISSLESYVANQIAQGGDPDFVVAGDWNDELDDPAPDNVFLPFLNDPGEYEFLTGQFLGSSTEYSYISGGFRSLIDHVLVTTSIENTYPGIQTRILKIDQDFTDYEPEVSDHRPVAVRVPVF